MAGAHTITPGLQELVDPVSARAGRSPAEVIADALEHGHSLDRQEQFVEAVTAGIAEAGAGNFATPEEAGRVLNTYRPG